MKLKLTVRLDKPYDVVFGKFEDFAADINAMGFSKCLVITDSNVEKLYKDKLSMLNNSQIVSFTAGEENKTLETYKQLVKKAFSLGLDRQSAIISLGGGVVGDVAGLVAGTYMRGIPFIQIPTTLLAMADSSIGGKAAVDFEKCKNLIGLFYQPIAVFIDIGFLKTLPADEIKNGMAEVIKHGIIADAEFFGFLEKNIEKILALDKELLLKCIKRSCEIKAAIVEEDEKEKGRRMELNFGHTVGHAIEIINRYKLKHGECIAEGMVKEAEISNKMGFLDGNGLERIKKIIRKLNLKTPKYNPNIIEIIKSDKKNTGGKIKLALPKKIGEMLIKDEVPLKIIGRVIEGIL